MKPGRVIGALVGLLLAQPVIARPAPAQAVVVPSAVEPNKSVAGTQNTSATSATPVRFGDHTGFGRLVFDVMDGRERAVTRMGDRLVVDLGGPARMAAVVPPHNVRTVEAGGQVVTIEITPGAGFRTMMVDGHFVLDIIDPSAKRAPDMAAKPLAVKAGAAAPRSPAVDRPASSAPGRAASMPAAAVEPGHAEPTATQAGSSVAHGEGHSGGQMPIAPDTKLDREAVSPPAAPPVASPDGDLPKEVSTTAVAAAPMMPLPSGVAAPAAPLPSGPATLVASAQKVPQAGPGHMVLLPFAPQTAAAAFRRGAEAVVVFDERRPIDLGGLQTDPVFASAVIQLLPSATVMRFTLAIPAELRMQRRGENWMIMAIGGDAVPPSLRSIAAQQDAARILLPARQPGLIVSVPDSATGGVLLVGTQHEGGEAVLSERRAPDFTLPATWQGVVVDAVSDALALRATSAGFVIGAEGEGRALAAAPIDPSAGAAEAASRLTRLFDLPNLPTEALVTRMHGAVASAALMPPQSRAEARRRVAESMLALGLDAEAQGVLSLAAIGDARSDEEPSARALAAVAGLLASREGEAAGLDDPQLNGFDEIALWRSVRMAMQQEGSAAAAAVFAHALPLVRSYPAELQRRLLPMIAETMVLGGETDAARRLLDEEKNNTALNLARAFLSELSGAEKAATTDLYKKLAQSPDRLVRLRASLRAVEWRLSSGAETPAEAAAELGRLLFAWRGDDRETDLRLRVAELRAQAGEWRASLQLLRETLRDVPERGEPTRERLKSVFSRSLEPASQARLSAFDAVALAEENADLMPEGEAGQLLAERLTDRLLELDLPDRVAPFLERIVGKTGPGVARAAFGGRLAALRLSRSDPAGALTALSATSAEILPPALLESRALSFAVASAKKGDMPTATRALLALDSEAADGAMASIAEASGNWADAQLALSRLAARAVPPSGNLDEGQARVMLRLASAVSRLGDDVGLAKLRVQTEGRLPTGQTRDLFRLLTAQPVRAVPELVGGARDMAVAKNLTGALTPLASR